MALKPSSLMSYFQDISIINETIGLTEKRFYMFLKSSKIPLAGMWKVIYELLGKEMLKNGKIIIALDDTTYGKSGKKIAGANTFADCEDFPISANCGNREKFTIITITLY